ncbi:hypothetical protein [Priestia endophytica]|uniref:hypothetical protein n=1 Tax=Priestia endophytica TaxID=135735 RepID=UPI000DCA7965|nr:hypothetical protein [Priestia endophytica]RAS85754.1 hypothetical protein A4U60_09020 [Priestia endophytica]
MYEYEYDYDRKDYYDDKHDTPKKEKCYCEEQDNPYKYEDKDDRKHNDKNCNCITINFIYNHAETGGQISGKGGQNANQGGQIAKKGGQNANQDSVVVKKHDKKNKNAKVKKYV